MLRALSPDASKLEAIIFTVNLTGAFFINKTTQLETKQNKKKRKVARWESGSPHK